MRDVLSECPECGERFMATIKVADDVVSVELPCSPECNLAMVQ